MKRAIAIVLVLCSICAFAKGHGGPRGGVYRPRPATPFRSAPPPPRYHHNRTYYAPPPPRHHHRHHHDDRPPMRYVWADIAGDIAAELVGGLFDLGVAYITTPSSVTTTTVTQTPVVVQQPATVYYAPVTTQPAVQYVQPVPVVQETIWR